MSALAPPSSGGGQHRRQSQQQQQRSSRYYRDNNSSSSNSSLSNISFNLELNGGRQKSPLPPPLLPLRTHRVIEQPARSDLVGSKQQRDSYMYCWSDGSGSTRLPNFPEEDNDHSYASQGGSDNIRLKQYSAVRPADIARVNNQQQQRRHRGPTAVVYPFIVTVPPSVFLQAAAAAPATSSTTSSESRSSVAGGQHRQLRRHQLPAPDHVLATRGCGGRCETCENVCYYLLQVAFAMGLLIGSSLCIAGAASPRRQLQVLLYIGALVALVSALLLVVQCRARRQAIRYFQPETVAAVQPVQQAQAQPIAMGNHKAIFSNNGTHMYQPQHKLLTTTTIQRGVPVTVTLLQHQQVLYNPENSSTVNTRNKETRILL